MTGRTSHTSATRFRLWPAFTKAAALTTLVVVGLPAMFYGLLRLAQWNMATLGVLMVGSFVLLIFALCLLVVNND